MYKVPSNIDLNKIFLVERKDTEGRLDSFFYKDEFQKLNDKLNNCKFKTVYFKDIIKTINNGYDFRDYKTEGVPYIKVANVKKGEFDFSKIQYIQFGSDDISKNIQLKKGNILLTRKGTYGNALSLDKDYDYVISSEVFYIELKQELVISKYLEIFFNSISGQKQFTRYSIGAIMGSLSQDALKILKIPLPDLSIQNDIVEIYQEANNFKKQKHSEARILLNKIDEYLLNELGLKLPLINNTIKSRIFEVNLNDISGTRFDPDYIGKYEFLINQKGNFNFSKLGDLLISSPQYGANEEAIKGNSENDIRYIRITDIDELGNLKKKGWKTANNTLDKYLLKYDDILFARSGSVGKCYIHKDVSKKSIFAGYLIRFKLNLDKIYPDYAFYYCNSSIYKYWVSAIERPSVQSNINSEEFKSLPIPLPPMSKQIEISEKISEIRKKSKALIDESNFYFDNKKREIESLILNIN